MPAQSTPPPSSLTLEEYAALAARLLQAGGKPTDVVLAELDIPADVWRAAAAAWERALDEELARGGSALLTTFAARFVATRTAIGRRSTFAPALPTTAPALPVEPAPVTWREPALERAVLPEVPDLPIGPGTAAVDRRHLARPAVPFAAKPAPPADDAARRAFAGVGLPFAGLPPGPPPPALRVDSPTVRLDACSLPPAPEPDPVLPLAHLEPPPPSWLQRFRCWLHRRSGRP